MLHAFKCSLGEEKIPRELLEIAQGVVFLTIVKVGFMFTGRYGTGLVVAKLKDGKWSAPSAVQLTGLGWGVQVGAELTDVMLILTTESAVNAFKSRAQVSVGAELGVSVGPIGRSIESDVTAGNKGAAHAFAYAQSKGLFVGASLEASGIAARKDVNRAFYGEKVSVSALLQGDYPSPKGADLLYRAIEEVLSVGKSSPSGNRGGWREPREEDLPDREVGAQSFQNDLSAASGHANSAPASLPPPIPNVTRSGKLSKSVLKAATGSDSGSNFML